MQCSEYHLPHINIFWVRIHFCLVYLYSSLHLHFTSQSYHLGGMGCSNGVVAINMVQDLLKVGSMKRECSCLISDRRNNANQLVRLSRRHCKDNKVSLLTWGAFGRTWKGLQDGKTIQQRSEFFASLVPNASTSSLAHALALFAHMYLCLLSFAWLPHCCSFPELGL